MTRYERITTINAAETKSVQYQLAQDMAGFEIVNGLNVTGTAKNKFANLEYLTVDLNGERILDLEGDYSGNTIDEFVNQATTDEIYDKSADSIVPSRVYIPFPQMAGSVLTVRIKANANTDAGVLDLFARYDGEISSVKKVIKMSYPKTSGLSLQIPEHGILDNIGVIGSTDDEQIKIIVNGIPYWNGETGNGIFKKWRLIGDGSANEIYNIPVGDVVGLNTRMERVAASTDEYTVLFTFLNPINAAGKSDVGKNAGGVVNKPLNKREVLSATTPARIPQLNINSRRKNASLMKLFR